MDSLSEFEPIAWAGEFGIGSLGVKGGEMVDRDDLVARGAKEYGMWIALTLEGGYEEERDHDSMKSIAKTNMDSIGAQMIEETFEITVPDDDEQARLRAEGRFADDVTFVAWYALGWPQ